MPCITFVVHILHYTSSIFDASLQAPVKGWIQILNIIKQQNITINYRKKQKKYIKTYTWQEGEIVK